MTDRTRIRIHHPLSWRGRWARASLLLLLVMLALRLVWGWHTAALLREQTAAIRSRGEPVTLEDVKFEPVPDAQNAFKAQMRAASLLVPNIWSPRNSNLNYQNYLPFPPAWMTLAAASEKAHGPLFAAMRQARRLSRVQIHDRIDSVYSLSLPHLSSMHFLANTLGDGAMYVHLQHNDAEALERVMDLLHLSRSLRHDPVLVSQLVAAGVESRNFQSIQVIAPGLDAPRDSQVRQEVKELIAQLLDEMQAWEGFERSMEFQRPWRLDALRTQASGAWVVSPLIDLVTLRMNRNCDVAIRASRQRIAPAAMDVLKDWVAQEFASRVKFIMGPAAPKNPPPVVPRYSRFFSPHDPSFVGVFQIHYRTIAERRATAVALAVRLYRLDHECWPDSLDQLVPQYLPAVPADPFRDDGQPLGYIIVKGVLPGGGDRPLLYFDAGPPDPAGWPGEPTHGWQQSLTRSLYQGCRQYRDLERWSPPRGPARAWSPRNLGIGSLAGTKPAATRPAAVR